jgi:hypothetical protein
VLTADDCNDEDADSTVRAADADCDNVRTEDDCNDEDAESTVRATDADCDGVLTDDDCDDEDAESTVRATDGDCDGVLTADDCNDEDEESTVRATDADCDNVLTADDCNDGHPDIYPGALDTPGDAIDQDCSGLDGDAMDCAEIVTSSFAMEVDQVGFWSVTPITSGSHLIFGSWYDFYFLTWVEWTTPISTEVEATDDPSVVRVTAQFTLVADYYLECAVSVSGARSPDEEVYGEYTHTIEATADIQIEGSSYSVVGGGGDASAGPSLPSGELLSASWVSLSDDFEDETSQYLINACAGASFGAMPGAALHEYFEDYLFVEYDSALWNMYNGVAANVASACDATDTAYASPPFSAEACDGAGGESAWVTDGYCDPENNTALCGYDGGDCCPSDCDADATYGCDSYYTYSGYTYSDYRPSCEVCLDPDSVDNTPGGACY